MAFNYHGVLHVGVHGKVERQSGRNNNFTVLSDTAVFGIDSVLKFLTGSGGQGKTFEDAARHIYDKLEPRRGEPPHIRTDLCGAAYELGYRVASEE